jgi:hypothetical protein
MTAPAKPRRTWRFYAVRSFATIFVVAGLSALQILVEDLSGTGVTGLLLEAVIDCLSVMAAIWTTLTIWGYDLARDRTKAD